MEHRYEKIVVSKKEKYRLKYTEIIGESVFINDKFENFALRKVNDNVQIYIPEEFIDMPEKIKCMKFPSVYRPQRIFTSQDGSVNFAFSLVDTQTPDNQIGLLAMQMKTIIGISNPATVFYLEECECLVSGHPICMFDFKNFGVDGQMYNMDCFTPLSCGTLHATFICQSQDAEDWKYAAWAAFKTISEINTK